MLLQQAEALAPLGLVTFFVRLALGGIAPGGHSYATMQCNKSYVLLSADI